MRRMQRLFRLDLADAWKGRAERGWPGTFADRELGGEAFGGGGFASHTPHEEIDRRFAESVLGLTHRGEGDFEVFADEEISEAYE